jgi:diguanylate cyclase (GGDEF)-like protein
VAFVSVPIANWFVVARMPTSEAFQPIEKYRRNIFKFSIALSVAMIVIILLFLSYTLRPLRESSRQMRNMADGQTPLAPLPVFRRDEVGVMVDCFNSLVKKVRDNEDRLEQLAHHDNLTGLPNRLSFLMRVEQTIALTLRQNGRLALLFIDLDGFKPINDHYGHKIGDLLLQQVATRLSEGVRHADLAARFGGDEFVVLLADIADCEAATAFAEKLIAKLSASYVIRDIEIKIGVSIGIALLPDDAENVESLIAQADTAMYEAKNSSGNCYCLARKQA